ncbi:hypothetical protein [Parvularcula marina]|uniref:Uncharacterized protein n=1 Tax=Parvularcula marina TaxID=2292771 RepID=A0A371RGL9_9PROT|nr:hypothetical protein [Parvularcula marina]RFB04565.1 hypothetical protein DX908_04265 [Parvularcula marina]
MVTIITFQTYRVREDSPVTARDAFPVSDVYASELGPPGPILPDLRAFALADEDGRDLVAFVRKKGRVHA